jgi:excisionase family DNA binding protein
MKARFISVVQFATMIGVGRTKVYEILRDGEVISTHLGRRRLIDRASAQQFARRLIERGDLS